MRFTFVSKDQMSKSQIMTQQRIIIIVSVTAIAKRHLLFLYGPQYHHTNRNLLITTTTINKPAKCIILIHHVMQIQMLFVIFYPDTSFDRREFQYYRHF